MITVSESLCAAAGPDCHFPTCVPSEQTPGGGQPFHPLPDHCGGPFCTEGMTKEAQRSQHSFLFLRLYANGQPGQMTKRRLNSGGWVGPGNAANWEPASDLCYNDDKRLPLGWARNYIHSITDSLNHPAEVGTIIVPILQMAKLRPRGAKYLGRGHAARKC